MRIAAIIVSVLLLQGCFPSMAPPKTTLKKVKDSNVEIEWFSHSSAYADAPDYITLKAKNMTDTIRSTNIADVKLENEKITFGFYGVPKKFTTSITLPESFAGYPISFDTTYVRKYRNKDSVNN